MHADPTAPRRTALVAGASGLVGRECLQLLAEDGSYSEVSALVRHELRQGRGTSRVRQIVVADFDELDQHGDEFAVDHVFCALGTTIRKAGSLSAFRRVDYDYPLTVARLAVDRGATHFLLVSAIGADGDSRIFYTRVKGELEDAIGRLGFRTVTIARPSFLLGDRKERRPGEALGKLLGRFAPARFRSVHARQVARALVLAAHDDAPGMRILENKDLLRTPA